MPRDGADSSDDLSGSLGFLSCTAFSLYFPALRARLSAGTPLPSPLSFHTRQILVSAFTAIWAGRLGTFLFQRIRKHGSDSRFDDIVRRVLTVRG